MKAVASLKDYLRNQFFRATHDSSLTDNTNFLSFEDWLEKRGKDQFNPLAEATSKAKAKPESIECIKESAKNRVHSNFISKDTQQNNNDKTEETSKPEDNKEKLTCWLCKDKHCLMDCF